MRYKAIDNWVLVGAEAFLAFLCEGYRTQCTTTAL